MALLQVNFYSQVLEKDTQMNVILPQKATAADGGYRKRADGLYPTLYLLHGMGSDYTSWLRKTSIERYAATKGLAVIMPDVQTGWYTDMAYRPCYWT